MSARSREEKDFVSGGKIASGTQTFSVRYPATLTAPVSLNPPPKAL